MVNDRYNAEQSLLGCLIGNHDRAVGVMPRLFDDLFGEPRHKKIFQAISHLSANGKGVDRDTVSGQLKIWGKLRDVGTNYVYELTESGSSPHNIESYADIVIEGYTKNRIHYLGLKMQSDFTNGILDVDDYLGGLVGELAMLKEGKEGIRIYKTEEILREVSEELKEGFRGIPTGYRDIDNIIIGLCFGELTLIGAEPSVGKTALSLNVADNISRVDPVLFVSLEQGRQSIFRRQVCSNARTLNSKELRRGKLSEEKQKEFDGVGRVIADDRELYIVERSDLNISQFRSIVDLACSRYKTRVVFLDYVQRMRPTNPRQDERAKMIEISSGLKAIAKARGIAVVALSQFARLRGRVPANSDFKESGSLEADADVAWLLHRPYLTALDDDGEKYETRERDPKTDLMISKNRDGETGHVKLYFHKEKTRFELLTANGR